MRTSVAREKAIARELKICVKQEAQTLTRFIKLLSELDKDRGYAYLGYSSLFDFCTKHLHLSNGEAATRVRLARLAQREERVLEVLDSGEVGMCCLRILAPVLSDDNFEEVIRDAKGKSARELEYLKSWWQNKRQTNGQKAQGQRNVIRFQSFPNRGIHNVSHSVEHESKVKENCPTAAELDTCPLASNDFATKSVTSKSQLAVLDDSVHPTTSEADTSSSQTRQNRTDATRATGTADCSAAESISRSIGDSIAAAIGSSIEEQKTVTSDKTQSSVASGAKESAGLETKYVRIAASISEQVWNKYEQACNYANCGNGPKDLSIMFEKMVDLFLEKEEKRRGIRNLAENGVESSQESSEKFSAQKGTSAETLGTNGSSSETVVCNSHEIYSCTEPSTNLEGCDSVRRVNVIENKFAGHDEDFGTDRRRAGERATKRSRYIPRAVAAEVWQRDGGQCTYDSPVTGRRCECKRGLQIDHIVPFAHGGSSRDACNLRLLCATHNRIAADDIFGKNFMKEIVEEKSKSAKKRENQNLLSDQLGD